MRVSPPSLKMPPLPVARQDATRVARPKGPEGGPRVRNPFGFLDPRLFPLTTATYPGVPLPDLSAARTWTPGAKTLDGSTANRTVTETYTRLDAGMSAYLGAPAAANWMSFGKYASREAGGQILRMEEMLKICYRLDADSLVDSLQDLAKEPGLLGAQGMKLLSISKGNPVDFVKNTKRMHDALVYGNTGVFADIAPAYDTFLRATAAGQDPIAALKHAGYGHGPKDPQGFLLEAFSGYRRAKALGDRAALATGEAKKDLLAERLEVVNRANVLVGIHEQMVVIQGPQIFGEPQVYKLLQALSSEMVMTDANGTLELLPHGGNWADFATRMGFSEVPAGAVADAFVVTDHAGVTHHYVLHPDATKRAGTIGQYFADALAGDRAKTLINGAPTPLPASYRDGNDTWRWVKRLAGAPLRWVRDLFGNDAPQPA